MTRGYHEQVLDVVRDAGQVRRELFDSLLEGYGLIQNRLGRVMKAERIERIPCEGNPVDPERMIVIEVVEDCEPAAGDCGQRAPQRLYLEGPIAPIRRGAGGKCRPRPGPGAGRRRRRHGLGRGRRPRRIGTHGRRRAR